MMSGRSLIPLQPHECNQCRCRHMNTSGATCKERHDADAAMLQAAVGSLNDYTQGLRSLTVALLMGYHRDTVWRADYALRMARGWCRRWRRTTSAGKIYVDLEDDERLRARNRAAGIA